jgi:hypothetical protein
MNAIDMTSAKDALNNLPADANEVERIYCAELASRLNERLVPVGIALSVQLLDYDCRRGKSGFSRPLHPKLVGHPPVMYGILALSAKRALVGALPEEARAEVETALS